MSDRGGFGLEKDMGSVLSTAGLAALVKQVRSRFDAQAPQDEGSPHRSERYARRRYGEMLRVLYIVLKDVEAYVGLAGVMGLTPQDCHAIATMLVARRKREEALSWVERGIKIDTTDSRGSFAGVELADLRRKLLMKLGRENEALESAWTEFCEHPSTYSYDDLMKFARKEDRPAWHEKAIEAAVRADRRSVYSLIGLLVQTKEIERLAELVGCSNDGDLQQVSHYALEPAARSLEKTHAGDAARLWCAMRMRIVSAGKSKYYTAALETSSRLCAATTKRGCRMTGSRL